MKEKTGMTLLEKFRAFQKTFPEQLQTFQKTPEGLVVDDPFTPVTPAQTEAMMKWFKPSPWKRFFLGSPELRAFQKAKEENSDELIGCHCYFDLQGRKIRGVGVITDLYEKTVHIKTKLGTFIRKWETHRIRAYPKYVNIKGV